MHISKTAIRGVPLLSAAVLMGILFGHPISAFLASEGATIGDLRLLQAQASLAVLQRAVGVDRDSAETDPAPSAAAVGR
ncbi:hypothetical protein [Rhizobium etli]|uniref:hypothetical protein n=1 Tax=Rhizobium etli TaxID=29449 RepID=UPI0003839F8C|nr:hypothetical protein [Rhizobium etli]AGS26542.1 hypothetical protein REMIM1_PF00880 [Rhizobium etli bv. mimosae str. Mim1]